MKELNDEEIRNVIRANAEKYNLNRGSITKINFIKNIDLIVSMQEQGFNKKEIWIVMKEKDLIFCEYPQFTKLFRKYITNQRLLQIKQNLMLNGESMHSENTGRSAELTSNTINNKNLNSSGIFSFNATANKQALI